MKISGLCKLCKIGSTNIPYRIIHWYYYINKADLPYTSAKIIQAKYAINF